MCVLFVTNKENIHDKNTTSLGVEKVPWENWLGFVLENPCPLGKGFITESLRKSGQQYHNARPSPIGSLDFGIRIKDYYGLAWSGGSLKLTQSHIRSCIELIQNRQIQLSVVSCMITWSRVCEGNGNYLSLKITDDLSRWAGSSRWIVTGRAGTSIIRGESNNSVTRAPGSPSSSSPSFQEGHDTPHCTHCTR